ncbi:unnamed protein product [Schistocephalus solidus]|uniref:Integrase_H2C2 domain-containing protein n=1 Tax=Schistocephalus solidus TaxID=70667 RepID=A0A183SUV6_SCHSO|nr:unnamed protein product [Schistocephalus solidus]
MLFLSLSFPKCRHFYVTLHLKAELLRLTSVSDHQRYRTLMKERALGDRKPLELLRRTRCPVGNMTIHDKLLVIFLDRLPATVQTFLDSGSKDLDNSKLTEMADRGRAPLALDGCSGFTAYLCHIDGARNEVADTLSIPSIAHLQLSPEIDPAEMAIARRRIGFSRDEDVSGLQIQVLPLTTDNGTILCDISTPHHPFLLPSLRCKVFFSLHNLFHPGSRATDKLVSDCFVRTLMHKDLNAWTRACLGCKRNKVQDTTRLPSAHSPALVQGCIRIFMTAYHPAANEMLEPFHRQLMASLRTADDSKNWMDYLPLVLLGI